MKKKTKSANSIIVISGVQKHPVRYRLWQTFSQAYVRRLTVIFGVIALIFVAGSIVYVNRIAVTDAVYAAFGLDLDKLAADLAGGGSDAVVDVKVNSESLGLVDETGVDSLPDNVVDGYLLDPDTSMSEMTPTSSVSDDDVRAMSDAAQVNLDDNYEEDAYGGYDD